MNGRWIIHLPWLAVVVAVGLIVAVQGLYLQPREIESARIAAVDVIRATLARDLSVVQSLARRQSLEEIQEFVSASSVLPGLEEMTLVSPEGIVLASTDIAQEDKPAATRLASKIAGVSGALETRFPPQILRAPSSGRVEIFGSIAFPSEDGLLRKSSHGVFYQRWNLQPIVQPVLRSAWDFMLVTALVALLFAVPLQYFVYHYVTRRLLRLANDAKRFGEGDRTGLFEDPLNDHIGRISTLLREATQTVANQEETAQRLALALESANAGIWEWVLDGNRVYTSPEYHTMHGDKPVSVPIPAKDIFARIHPDDIERIHALLAALNTPGNNDYDAEFRMRGASNNTYRWIRSTGRVVDRAPDGMPARMLGQHVDITARRDQEDRQRVLDARMRRLFENVAHAITVLDREARFVMVNHVAAEYLGTTPDQLIGRFLGDVVPELRNSFHQRVEEALALGRPVEQDDEVRLLGVQRWFRTIIQPMENDAGDSVWVLVTSYEISERMRGEARALAQEARYRTLVESTSAILWEADPETLAFTFVNQESEAVLGYPASRWTEDPGFWPAHIHPADRERTVHTCATATKRCESHVIEYRMIHADGGIVWLRDIINVLAKDGKPVGLVGVMINITREKQEEERFQAAFESIPIGNIVVDDHGAILLANPAAQRMFGYASEELAEMRIADLIPTAHLPAPEPTAESWPADALKSRDGTREANGVRRNGEPFPLRLAVGLMHNGDIRTYVCSAIDLSDIKSLEAQLAQSQKMEAVGQLAGGIAHDFNNLLHVITGFTELARDTLPEDEPVQAELEQIAQASERAASLTRQLLAFSRRQVMEPRLLDINEIIARISAMLGRVIGEHIKVEVLCSPQLARVYADPGMIEQVLMNLCVNARDAMPKGGILQIETENVVLSETYCLDHLWGKPGRYVLVSVTDTGCGMSREMQEHIFEPFYTTKSAQQGTGLGLSTVYGIVKQHDGVINVYSEVGRGTTFKIYLPHSERLAEHVGTKIEGEVPLGSETILVVEDDSAVRALSRVMLEGAGYTVLEAENGRRAVQCFRANHKEIQLVLLDVVMPDMGGRDAYDQMLKIEPNLRALFASGYSENAIHTNFVLDNGLALLKKPFGRNDLLRAVRRILDGDGNGAVLEP